MDFDTDKFISCIQNNPSIWEVWSKDYMNSSIKENKFEHYWGILIWKLD